MAMRPRGPRDALLLTLLLAGPSCEPPRTANVPRVRVLERGLSQRLAMASHALEKEAEGGASPQATGPQAGGPRIGDGRPPVRPHHGGLGGEGGAGDMAQVSSGHAAHLHHAGEQQ